ncbi:MAG TPA: beta-glucuronidase, partial [Balneolaceae bacterium]|nr:beta-glucuronidase [Balneolaceae bacterium]
MSKIKVVLLLTFLASSTGIFAQGQLSDKPIQNIEARDKVTLDGLWSIIVDPLENGYYNYRWQPKDNGYFMDAKMENPSDLIEYNFDTSYQIMVPGDWNTQMEKLYFYEGTVWYKKSFDYDLQPNERAYVYFEAANYEAIAYLNGEKLGEHIGGYTPFQFEVTDVIKEKDNFLVVKVDNKRLREAIPTINTDWWNYGGITRSVHLIKTPQTYIKDYYLQLADGSTNKLEGWVELNDDTSGEMVQLGIPELNISEEFEVRNGKVEFMLDARPELWSPKNPKLYDVYIKMGENVIEDEIGFRTIETDGTNILLNGEEIFLKGISIHEEAPFKTGRVTAVEEVRILLQWAKELGVNFVRLAHYPHNEAMVREAEKMGLMVWSEIPVYWTVLFENEDTFKNAEQQLEDMMIRDKNRAAVVLWSIANETPVSEGRNTFLKNLADRARAIDDTRL